MSDQQSQDMIERLSRVVRQQGERLNKARHSNKRMTEECHRLRELVCDDMKRQLDEAEEFYASEGLERIARILGMTKTYSVEDVVERCRELWGDDPRREEYEMTQVQLAQELVTANDRISDLEGNLPELGQLRMLTRAQESRIAELELLLRGSAATSEGFNRRALAAESRLADAEKRIEELDRKYVAKCQEYELARIAADDAIADAKRAEGELQRVREAVRAELQGLDASGVGMAAYIEAGDSRAHRALRQLSSALLQIIATTAKPQPSEAKREPRVGDAVRHKLHARHGVIDRDLGLMWGCGLAEWLKSECELVPDQQRETGNGGSE